MIRNFYICFDSATCWWKIFLKKGFGHISLLCKDKFNWVYFEPFQTTLVSEILPVSGDEALDEVVQIVSRLQPKTIIRVITDTSSNQLIMPRFGFMTCTTLIKYMTGIKLFSYSPYHFYKKLIKIHGNNSTILSVEVIQEGEYYGWTNGRGR